METKPSYSRYEVLRDEALDCLRRGEIEAAERRYRESLQLAREMEDPVLEDRAYCNLAAVRIGREPEEGWLFRLRQIMTRRTSGENGFLAAYNLARIYEHRQDPKKGLFYAGIALERLKELGGDNGEWRGMALLQMANLLVAESYFDRAEVHYRQALALSPPPPRPLLTLVTQNLGYCRVMQGEPREGLGLLYRSLREQRHAGTTNPQIHLDVAFALLEEGRHRQALRHAARGLAAAREEGLTEEVKKALYLLGEATVSLGDEDRARQHFDQLQDYFPEAPFLSDLLLTTDVRSLINLRA